MWVPAAGWGVRILPPFHFLIKVYFNKMKLEENPGHYPHLPPTPGTPVILSFRTAFICGVAVRLERMSVGGPRF